MTGTNCVYGNEVNIEWIYLLDKILQGKFRLKAFKRVSTLFCDDNFFYFMEIAKNCI